MSNQPAISKESAEITKRKLLTICVAAYNGEDMIIKQAGTILPYAVSVSRPDKVYRDCTVDFFNRHIEVSVRLGCDRMVVSTGFAYLNIDAEEAFGWCCEAMGRIARKVEAEGVTLAVEPFTKYTTHICNQASQLARLLKAVIAPG